MLSRTMLGSEQCVIYLDLYTVPISNMGLASPRDYVTALMSSDLFQVLTLTNMWDLSVLDYMT